MKNNSTLPANISPFKPKLEKIGIYTLQFLSCLSKGWNATQKGYFSNYEYASLIIVQA